MTLSEGEVPENVSRFYLKKKVIVGNTSKFIPTGTVPQCSNRSCIWLTHRHGAIDSRDGDDRSTHKWMVYVRGPAEVCSAPNLARGRSS